MTFRAQFGIFGITHNGNVICNMQLQTSPLVLGDSMELMASFIDTNIPCEQVLFLLSIQEIDDYFALL